MGKDKKKHKKEKKQKKHKKEKKRKQSSSESSDSSEGEWVEKGASTPRPAPEETSQRLDDKPDDWGSIFGGVSTAELRKAKEAEKNKERVSLESKPGQSTRELNPYWRNGGTGLPPERDSAQEDGRSDFKKLDEDDRGSSRFRKPNEDDRGSSGRFRRPDDDRGSSRFRKPNEDDRGSSGRFRRPDDDDRGSSRFRKPNEDDLGSSGRFRRPDDDDDRGSSSRFRKPDGDDRGSPSRFRRPDDSHGTSGRSRKPDDDKRSLPSRFRKPDEDDRSLSRSRRPDADNGGRGSSSRFRRPDEEDRRDRGRFRKPDHDDPRERQLEDRMYSSKSASRDSGSRGWRKTDPNNSKPAPKQESPPPLPLKEKSPEKSTSPEVQVLTSDELNDLNAKLFRAELMGDSETAEKLKKVLANTRRASDEDKTIILTQTDGKGFTRPVRDDRGQSSKKRRVQTHENKNRVRYFADDDDYSLQDMYEKEKYSSARDQEEDFMNLMGKEMARKDGSLALDDPFEETASMDTRGKKSKQDWDRAVRDQAKKQKIYDECKWCLGAQRNNQSLIVKSKSKVYVTVPTFQSLTEGHCLIVPHSHVSCATQLDEDVWDEIMETRKELVRLFEKNDDQDVIFFENASHIHKHPHMLIHCVPVPREIGDTAPIYFKKALLECESEWSNNKKVVELAGKGVRKAVPKGLPYFFVDFGDQYGYAHVIEDLKLFPNNFAQEIIGGMMDLDHELWRKQRNVSEEQLSKNLKFLKDLINESDEHMAT